MEPFFFAQFPPADKAAWRAQVQRELRDSATLDSLRWQPDPSGRPDDFGLEPYYTAVDMTDLPLPAIQAAQKKSPGWLNAPAYSLSGDPKADNATLRDALDRGAEALVLTVTGSPDLPRLLNGIKLSDIPVYFRLPGAADAFLKALRPITPYQLRGGLLTDEVATPALLQQTADSPQFYPVSASGHGYHNAGATATQELAFMLGSLADQYDSLTDAGLTVDQLMAKTLLSVSVGTSYFTEIAKLRALRVLWVRFLAAYRPDSAIVPAIIQAQTSSFYEAIRSPYTNLLRGTTEALAAVAGGCDVLTVQPYNALLTGVTPADRAFGERIARNMSILLSEESYLNRVADPSAGSYYIETLTHELTESAWTLFLRVEAMGGLAKSTAFVRSEIETAYWAKVDALTNGRMMVGINAFREEEGSRAIPDLPETEPVDYLPHRRLASVFE